MESSSNKVEVNNISDRASRKSGKDDKSRRKDEKSIDQVMKSLNNMETPEEKLSAMCKKYSEVMDENRKLQLAAKQWEKGVTTLQREKEQIQTDHSKAVLTRSRLESLCRELQRQNKAVKEESLQKVREEEEKRKEVSAKFNATLAEITTLMSSSNEKTNKLRDENVDITKKFRSICEQSGLQQQQVDKMNMQRKLEAELSEAKLTKQKLEFTAEKELMLRDKQQLLLDLQETRAKVSDLLANEMNLKTQVAMYADRYEEFQNALSRSNEVFGGFKGEMDKMSKKIVKLEKETLSWKSRWEKSHQSLLEMATDKQQRDAELALVTRQLTQLQKLCRTLQTERVSLLAQVKDADKTSDSTETPQEIKLEDGATLPITEPECPMMKEDQSAKSQVDGKKGAQSKSNKKAKITTESKLKEAAKSSNVNGSVLPSDNSVNNSIQKDFGNSTNPVLSSSQSFDDKLNSMVAESTKILTVDDVQQLLSEMIAVTSAPPGTKPVMPKEKKITSQLPNPDKSKKEDLNIATQVSSLDKELKHKKPQKTPEQVTPKPDLPTTEVDAKSETATTEEHPVASDDVSLPTNGVPDAPVTIPEASPPVEVISEPAPEEPSSAPEQEAPPTEPPTVKPVPNQVQPEMAEPVSEPVKVVPPEVKKGKEGAKKRKK